MKCVARYIKHINRVMCGIPNIKWESPEHYLPASIKKANEGSGKCTRCVSYIRAKYIEHIENNEMSAFGGQINLEGVEE